MRQRKSASEEKVAAHLMLPLIPHLGSSEQHMECLSLRLALATEGVPGHLGLIDLIFERSGGREGRRQRQVVSVFFR